MGLTYLFITHDLSVVKHISDEICVMYLGKMVEKCATEELFHNTCHPYTKALLSAIPIPIPRILLKGELPSPIPPSLAAGSPRAAPTQRRPVLSSRRSCTRFRPVTGRVPSVSVKTTAV